MAWTAPRTWVTGEVVTATLLNTHLRDNMIDLDRRTTITGATVATSETTASTSYTDLATSGPAVTVTVGSTGQVLLATTAYMDNSSADNGASMSAAISGATTIAAGDAIANSAIAPAANRGDRQSATCVISGLNSGSTTFTAKYQAVIGGTARFIDRRIFVTPLGS